jgi:outer membrane protein insertion porin family
VIPLLLGLLLAGPVEPDTGRVVLLGVSVRAATADSALIVRTAGLSARQILSPTAFRNEIDGAVRRIYGLGLFSQVEVETTRIADGVHVVFAAREFPRLRSVQFEGFRRIKRKDLESKVKPKEGEILTDKKVFDWQQEILALYKSKGFLLVKVEPVVARPDSQGMVRLTYNIDEGDAVRIRSIEFYGNEALTDAQLGGQLKNRAKRWWRKGNLDEEEFIKDLDRVVDAYKQRGFIEATVADYDMKFDAGWVDISISVTEGRRYYFGAVTFEGESAVAERDLRRIASFERGRPYNTKLTQNALSELYGAYSEEGYIYAQVAPVEAVREDTIDLNYQIAEGSPARIRLVEIEGNEQTKEKVIRREVSSLPGYTFKRSEVIRSQRDIFNLGFFEDVQLDYRRADTTGAIDLVYRVKEKGFFGTVGAGVTYSATDKVTGYLELQQPNLLGRGQRVSVKLEKGGSKTNVELGFTEPWLFDRPTSAGADVSYLTRTYSYYEKQEISGGLSFSRPLPLDYSRAYLGLRVSDAYVPPTSISSSYVPPLGDTGLFNIKRDTVHKTAFSPSITFSRDSRDYIYNPLAGAATSYSLSLSFGDIRFHRHILDASQYLPLFWKFGLMGRARVGYISGFTATDTVPIYERFTPGGTGSDGVRGYGEQSIGPRIGGYNIGGRAEAIFTLEYKLRVSRQLTFLAFADAGNTWDSPKQFNFSGMKRGAGAGVRIEIPMLGLIGFDFGYGFDKDTPGWEPHFQIGRTF